MDSPTAQQLLDIHEAEIGGLTRQSLVLMRLLVRKGLVNPDELLIEEVRVQAELDQERARVRDLVRSELSRNQLTEHLPEPAEE